MRTVESPFFSVSLVPRQIVNVCVYNRIGIIAVEVGLGFPVSFTMLYFFMCFGDGNERKLLTV